ncbi:MAG: zf-HC2 domain-containing protein [Ilumatobacteraceae bacterium]
MECLAARELISSAVDDELPAADGRQLDEHLAGCPLCRGYAERVSMLTRAVRLRGVEPMPDLASRVLERARPPRLGRGGWIRPALAWVAVVIAAQSIQPLVFGDASGATTHIARHLGAFGLALSIGMAYAAWRPHRAFGMLPFAAALVATTTVSAVLDVTDRVRTPLAEAVHVTELVGLVLMWMIAGSPGWERLTTLTTRVWQPLRR